MHKTFYTEARFQPGHSEEALEQLTNQQTGSISGLLERLPSQCMSQNKIELGHTLDTFLPQGH